MPRAIATVTAAVRSLTDSFSKMRVTWLFTVVSLMNSSRPVVAASRPGPLPAGAEGWTPPKRIVYVSCNPATLARDAGMLCHVGGWTLKAVGAVNMFPHTAHVESIAVFTR